MERRCALQPSGPSLSLAAERVGCRAVENRSARGEMPRTEPSRRCRHIWGRPWDARDGHQGAERMHARECNVIRKCTVENSFDLSLFQTHAHTRTYSHAHTRQARQTHLGTGRPPASEAVCSGTLAAGSVQRRTPVNWRVEGKASRKTHPPPSADHL